jgi:hypothetical protein
MNKSQRVLLVFGLAAVIACVLWLAFGEHDDFLKAIPEPQQPPSAPTGESDAKSTATPERNGIKRNGNSDDPNMQNGPVVNHIDATIDRYSAADLCDDPRIEKGATVQDLIAYARKNVDVAKLANTQAQLKALCDPSNTILSLPLVQFKDRETYIAEHSEFVQDAIAFASLAVEVDSDGKRPMDNDEVVRFVKKHVVQPTSLHEFLEVLRVLGDSGLLKVALRNSGYPQVIQRDVEAAAAILAACGIFGGCEADSVFSVGLCFLNCVRPMSADEFAVSTIPVRDVDTAERAAAAIVNTRRGN